MIKLYLFFINLLCIFDTINKYTFFHQRIYIYKSSWIDIAAHRVYNYGFAYSLFKNKNEKCKISIHIMIFIIGLLIAINNGNIYLLAIINAAFYNLLDRIIYGYVIDYIKVNISTIYNFPTFNIVDMLVVVNWLLLIFSL